MKHVLIASSLLNVLMLTGAAVRSFEQEPFKIGSVAGETTPSPKFRIGIAIGVGSRKFPFGTSFNQDLLVFDKKPSRIVANFYANSKMAIAFLKTNFVSLMQSIKSPDDIATLSQILETNFDAYIYERYSPADSAAIIATTAVEYNFVHLLATTYAWITATQSARSVFAPGQPVSSMIYMPYQYWYKNPLVLYQDDTPKLQYAVAGALQAGKTAADSAECAFLVAIHSRENSYEQDSENSLSFVQLDWDDASSIGDDLR